MGDTKKWAADHDEEIRGIKELIKKNKTSIDLSYHIKDLILFCDNRRLTRDERKNVIESINQLIKVLNSVSGIDQYTFLIANVYFILQDETHNTKRL